MLLKRKPPPKQHGREVQIPALENLSLRPTAQCLYRNRCGEIPRMMVWALKELADPARAGYCSCEPPTKVNIEVHIWQALFYACVRVKHGHSSEHINFYLALTHKYPVLLKIVNAYVKIPIAIASLTSFLLDIVGFPILYYYK